MSCDCQNRWVVFYKEEQKFTKGSCWERLICFSHEEAVEVRENLITDGIVTREIEKWEVI